LFHFTAKKEIEKLLSVEPDGAKLRLTKRGSERYPLPLAKDNPEYVVYRNSDRSVVVVIDGDFMKIKIFFVLA